MSDRRVVITGLGAITPIGLTVESYWQGLTAGKSGVGPITLFDAENFPIKVAAEVKGFDPNNYMQPKRVDRTGRCTHFGIAATKMALQSSGLDMSRENPEGVGVVIGTSGMVSLAVEQGKILEERGLKRMDPLFISRMSPHMVPVQVALEIGAKGPNSSINSACASGSDSIATALNHIRLGHADVMITGGAEGDISPLTIGITGLVGALTRNPDPGTASRPFDLNRSGFVFGEGAGIMILETYEHAATRGAPMLAELAGAGWSYDATNETAPNFETEAQAMKMALNDAEVTPQQVDYINAHGTSTKLNDLSETNALKRVFGDQVYRIPISSNKSMIGHLAAAAGAVEAIASVLTLQHGIIPPTINYETPDPECDLDYVPNEARQKKVNVCLSDSFGLGGQNCCLVIKRI